MKRLLIQSLIYGYFLFLNIFLQNGCYCQAIGGLSLPKKKMDIEDIKSWPTLGIFPKISKNGAYFMYEILNQPTNSVTLVIRSTIESWEKRIIGISSRNTHFSGDSKLLVYQKGDSLFFLTLGSSSAIRFIAKVYDFSFPIAGADNWFIYRSKNPDNQSTLYYFNTGKELVLPNSKAFSWNKNGTFLINKTEVTNAIGSVRTLQYFDLNKGVISTIWSDSLDCGDIALSEDGLEVAFTVYSPSIKSNDKIGNAQIGKTIWYFKEGMKTANLKVNSNLLNRDYDIVGRLKFIEKSNWLIFDFQNKTTEFKTDASSVNVKIWSYKDKILLPEQSRLLNDNGQKSWKAALNLISNQIIPIENDSDFLSHGPIGEFAIIKGENFIDESWWKINPPHSTILLSLKDGKRTVLKRDNISLIHFSFSPNGKWLVYFDKEYSCYFSCNLETGKIINFTKSVPTSFLNEYALEGNLNPVFGVVCWTLEDNNVILYDNFDIWKVDPSGIRPAINITNDYGKKNKLKLRLVYGNDVKFGTRKNTVSLFDTLLIAAFSPKNKYNGFFRKTLNERVNPQQLFMGPYTFYVAESQKAHWWSFSDGVQPIKADSANVWVVSRESTNESLNYFLTKDFMSFRPLTNLFPEQEFNWLSAKIITWKQFDGTLSQGVLYKPEDFDPKKKYPLLFTYYEKVSHRLYEFPEPEFTNGDINIPWFVTHGYLVFTPDIHYKIASKSGKTTGEWAYNSIVSAAQFLSKMPYIDKTKMGIEGHSFGGGETNFIITHTNMFAAACEFAGYTDAVSSYLTLVPAFAPYEHFSKQSISESGQGRIGATLWERPDLYLKLSAVLHADRIKTPLLIAHNERDNNISWRQGLELYMALRRLEKKVWMLQYDDVHTLFQERNAIDFTIRITQFFDYYLKNQLPPGWMKESPTANLIGTKNRYELEKKQNK